MKRPAWLVWGVAALAFYSVVAWLFPGRLGNVPILDGFFVPSSYHWVNPPVGFEDGNIEPQGTRDVIEFFDDEVSAAASVATPDAQAAVIIPEGAFEFREAESVIIKIDPLDPARFAEPPEGLVIDGNAYAFAAQYANSESRAELKKPVSIFLRYAVRATKLLHHTGSSWEELETDVIGARLEVVADTSELGVFAPGGPRREEIDKGVWRYVLWAVLAAAVLGAVFGFVARVRTGGNVRSVGKRRKGASRRRPKKK